MGMADMFTDNADLSSLLETPLDLKVSYVVHKAFIEVNEEGSEAAAASSGITILAVHSIINSIIFINFFLPFSFFHEF